MKNLKQSLLILIIGLIPAMQAQSATVDFTADSRSLEVGETLEFSIFATGFDELAGGTIDFGISTPSYVSVDDVLVDSRWDFDPKKGELNGSTWKGIAFDSFFNEPLIGDGLIATVSITGVKAGNITLTVLDSSSFFSKTVDLNTTDIINSAGFNVSVESPSSIPVPASVWFLGSALFGLVGLRRKKFEK